MSESEDGKLYTAWQDTSSAYITSWDEMVPGTAYYWITAEATDGTSASFEITFKMPAADTDITTLVVG